MDIRKQDALHLLQSLSDKSVDMILTDPPYYKLLKVEWDNQWKTKEEYLEWLEGIIKECQRVLKDNGSFYMFCSSNLQHKVVGISDKYFNILNTIRWIKVFSPIATRVDKKVMRTYGNMSEEIIFAEQKCQYESELKCELYEPIRKYLALQKKSNDLTNDDINSILGVASNGGGMASHYFGVHKCGQWMLPTEEHYNKLKEHMDLKPYNEIKAEYEALRRPFRLSADKPYNNTWHFKQTPSRKGRHPCEKPQDLIRHIIETSSNEGDLIVDPFCGSGVVPQVCQATDRRCIAGDVDISYIK